MLIVTVGAIIEKDGKILLTKRNHEPFKGRWALPGGHVEQDEKAEDAILREIKEETDLDIQPEFLFYHDEIFPEENWHAVVLVFHAAAKGMVKINEESTEYGWFVPEEACKMELGFSHEKVISRWIGRRA